MIICPNCSEELTEQYSCDSCRYQATIKENNYISFAPEYDNNCEYYESAELDSLYKYEENYFWFKCRRKVVLNAFDKYISKNENILEIGAGTGSIARMLLDNGYNNISVGDIHTKGLEYAKSYGIENRYQFDVTKSPFDSHFDVVGMFDVLEHISQDELVIQNVHKSLRGKGKVILTVPAHMWLWNKNDEIACHNKRYELSEIKALLLNNGFKILQAKNFFLSILPLLYVRKMLDTWNSKKPIEQQVNGLEINSLINSILEQVTNTENSLLQGASPNIGGSIIAVAEKND